MKLIVNSNIELLIGALRKLAYQKIDEHVSQRKASESGHSGRSQREVDQ